MKRPMTKRPRVFPADTEGVPLDVGGTRMPLQEPATGDSFLRP